MNVIRLILGSINMKFTCFLLLFTCLSLQFQTLPGIEQPENSKSTEELKKTSLQAEAIIEVFVRDGCSHCAEAEIFLKGLQSEHPGLRVIEHDISKDPQALAKLKSIAASTQQKLVAVPTFVLGGQVIVGFSGPEGTGKAIRDLLGLNQQLKTGQTALPDQAVKVKPSSDLIFNIPLFGEVDLSEYSLPVFTIIIGLIDGYNPCAMWVLLFIIALLMHFKSRRKMLLVAGVFVLVSGIVYFLFMTAWLNFFLLLGAGRWIQITLGFVALFAGVVHVKDYFAFHKGVSLSIPDAAKPWIGRRINKILQAENLLATLIAVSVLAFLVNAVELLCTAGLPAIYTQVLSSHALPGWKYYSYLVLYNIAYMFDDMMVVFIAVLTLNPQRLGEKEGRTLKLLSGLIMIGLAILLFFKPDWLNWKF